MDVTRLGSQRVQHLFTQLRKVAQHPLLIRARYNEEQVGMPYPRSTYNVHSFSMCVLGNAVVVPCVGVERLGLGWCFGAAPVLTGAQWKEVQAWVEGVRRDAVAGIGMHNADTVKVISYRSSRRAGYLNVLPSSRAHPRSLTSALFPCAPQLREMAHIAATRDLFGGSPTVERCLQELTSYSDHQLHIFSGGSKIKGM